MCVCCSAHLCTNAGHSVAACKLHDAFVGGQTGRDRQSSGEECETDHLLNVVKFISGSSPSWPSAQSCRCQKNNDLNNWQLLSSNLPPLHLTTIWVFCPPSLLELFCLNSWHWEHSHATGTPWLCLTGSNCYQSLWCGNDTRCFTYVSKWQWLMKEGIPESNSSCSTNVQKVKCMETFNNEVVKSLLSGLLTTSFRGYECGDCSCLASLSCKTIIL